MTAPAGRVRQDPQAEAHGSQGQKHVDQRQPDDELDHDDQHEQPVHEVDRRQEEPHPGGPGLDRLYEDAQRAAYQVARLNVQLGGHVAGYGVSQIDHERAPPQRRCGGREAQTEMGHHLLPTGGLAAQVLAHDQRQPPSSR